MKKIIKHIFVLLCFFAIAVSCRDEDSVRFPDLATGVNARLQLYADRSYINLADISSAAVAFDVYSINNDIDELVYTATYVDASSPNTVFPPAEAIRVPGSAFTNGKATEIQITAAELAAALGLPGGASHFDGGDNVTFTTTARLRDGRVFTAANSAPSITGGAAASFTTLFTVFVGCPSPANDITSGTYKAEIHLEDSDGAPPFGLPDSNTKTGVTIALVGPEPFRYRVSSHDAGWWARPDITDTEGGPADFFDICGDIVMQPKPSFGFGGANDNGGGSYDPVTGIITMNWYNAGNDIFGFVTYTPE